MGCWAGIGPGAHVPCVAWVRLLGAVGCDGQTFAQNAKNTCDMPAARVGVARLAYAHLGVCLKGL